MRRQALVLALFGVGAALWLGYALEKPVTALPRAAHASRGTKPVLPAIVQPHALPPVATLTRAKVAAGDVSPAAERVQANLGLFDTWLRDNHVTPEQEGRVMQLLADAEANYRIQKGLAAALNIERSQLMAGRMTDDQSKRVHAAAQATQSAATPEERDAAFAELSASLSAVGPGTLNEVALEHQLEQMQSAQNLADDVYKGMGEFLTEEQVSAFYLAFPSFDLLLEDPVVATRTSLAAR